MVSRHKLTFSLPWKTLRPTSRNILTATVHNFQDKNPGPTKSWYVRTRMLQNIQQPPLSWREDPMPAISKRHSKPWHKNMVGKSSSSSNPGAHSVLKSSRMKLCASLGITTLLTGFRTIPQTLWSPRVLGSMDQKNTISMQHPNGGTKLSKPSPSYCSFAAHREIPIGPRTVSLTVAQLKNVARRKNSTLTKIPCSAWNYRQILTTLTSPNTFVRTSTTKRRRTVMPWSAILWSHLIFTTSPSHFHNLWPLALKRRCKKSSLTCCDETVRYIPLDLVAREGYKSSVGCRHRQCGNDESSQLRS